MFFHAISGIKIVISSLSSKQNAIKIASIIASCYVKMLYSALFMLFLVFCFYTQHSGCAQGSYTILWRIVGEPWGMVMRW